VVSPTVPGELLNQWLKTPQAVSDTGPEYDGSPFTFIKKLIGFAAEILQIPHGLVCNSCGNLPQ
jgi:hypothetical protein